MPIKNYTTKVPAVQTVGEIQGLLASHGARKVMMDYSENGTVKAVTFGLMLNGIMAGFKVDARPDGVATVMKKDETEQATMEQVFLPYLLDAGEKTLYEKVLESGFAPALMGGSTR